MQKTRCLIGWDGMQEMEMIKVKERILPLPRELFNQAGSK